MVTRQFPICSSSDPPHPALKLGTSTTQPWTTDDTWDWDAVVHRTLPPRIWVTRSVFDRTHCIGSTNCDRITTAPGVRGLSLVVDHLREEIPALGTHAGNPTCTGLNRRVDSRQTLATSSGSHGRRNVTRDCLCRITCRVGPSGIS